MYILYNYNIGLAAFVTTHLSVVARPAEPWDEAGHEGILSGCELGDPSSSLVEDQKQNNQNNQVSDYSDYGLVIGKPPARTSENQEH